MPKLFHISETENIQKFIPRISKKQWGYEKYVWAITEEKLHNYLLPRECPRICIAIAQSEILKYWFDSKKIENKKAIIVVPNDWKEKTENSFLYKYEFDPLNFKIIDKIAGYYVSNKTEIPIGKVEIKNCKKELIKFNTELVFATNKEMIDLKERVVNNLKEFSIIKWSNFN